jgi:uncharacterized protein (TIGR02996 family)
VTDDQRALLAAIVADPADDTARLVYADCIEEQGNSARAEFIRLQIEAERLHPDSNARARLERRAGKLFVEHWIEWWGEVCGAVGLWVPRRKPSTRAGRMARWLVNLGMEGDNPYTRERFVVHWEKMAHAGHIARTAFRRGFPESSELSFPLPPGLHHWAAISPISEITLYNTPGNHWYDGPHLASLRRLALLIADPVLLQDVLTSPHLLQLEELRLLDSSVQLFRERDVLRSEEITMIVASARPHQLRRVALAAVTDNAVETLANSRNLAGLESLDVQLSSFHLDMVIDESEVVEQRIETLANSPNLAGLRELAIGGALTAAACRQLTCGARWHELQRLAIDDILGSDPGDNFSTFSCERLPALQELRFRSLRLDSHMIDFLVRSPLLKQIRHLAIRAWGVSDVSDSDLRRMPQMFDLDRIETFAFQPDHQKPGLDELKRQLGDRLRMS